MAASGVPFVAARPGRPRRDEPRRYVACGEARGQVRLGQEVLGRSTPRTRLFAPEQEATGSSVPVVPRRKTPHKRSQSAILYLAYGQTRKAHMAANFKRPRLAEVATLTLD